LLIEKGADLQASDTSGMTPLSVAVTAGDADLTRLLLDAGANPKYRLPGGTPLIIRASRDRHAEIAGYLIGAGAGFGARAKDGTTVLMAAVQGGLSTFVELLLSWGADPNARRTTDGGTALGDSICFGYKDIEARLKNVGAAAPENLVCRQTISDTTPAHHPLFAAAASGSVATVKRLLRAPGAVETKDAEGRNALFHAVLSGNPEVVSLLVEGGLDPSAPDERGMTPLMAAAQSGHEDVMRTLLRRGARGDWRTGSGRSALMYAAMKGRLEAVRTLIDEGVALNFQDNDGMTALHFAAAAGHTAVVEKLIQSGAKRHLKDRRGEGILIKAVQSGSGHTVGRILSSQVNVNETAPDGRTPISVATENGFSDIAGMLKKRGAKPIAGRQDRDNNESGCLGFWAPVFRAVMFRVGTTRGMKLRG
jgi:serine/threonine-protein phosphatase 6 regulatory ankyrin repeat subunit B